MKQRYLLCPQCGSPSLFVKNEDGSQTFFHLTWERERVPFKDSTADVQHVKLDQIFCAACSWKGHDRKLVKYLS